MKTHVFHGNLWKTLGKHMLSVGTYGKPQGNISCLSEPIENNMKNTSFPCETMEDL